MPRGITEILFSQEDIDNNQVVLLPQTLLGCKVYGIRTNNQKVFMGVEMYTETLENIKKLEQEGHKYSGVKWVYGRVNSLEDKQIAWSFWYNDLNNNEKYEPDLGEAPYNFPPLEKILNSKIKDIYEIKSSYNISNTISAKFDKETDFMPTLYWIEPFLIYPELYKAKNPKGAFIIPIDYPKPYSAIFYAQNSMYNKDGQIILDLSQDKNEAAKKPFYYGDTLYINITTLMLVPGTTVLIEILEESTNELLWSTTTKVEEKISEDTTNEGELMMEYLNNLFNNCYAELVLSIGKKPADQKKNQARTFLVRISSTNLENIWKAFPPINNILDRDSLRNLYKTATIVPLYQTLTGYITVVFKNTSEYIEGRQNEVNQIVQKPAKVKAAPGCEPCYYSQIVAQRYKGEDFNKTDGESVIVFDENKRVKGDSQPRVDIISGDTSPAYLKLKSDLHTKGRCHPDKHTHGGKSVFSFERREDGVYIPAEKQNIQVIGDIKEKEINLSLPYIYIKDKQVAGTVSTFPFNYFWLTEKDAQAHVVLIETCRYQNDVLINVFPDISWYIKFEYSCTNPIKYRDSWVAMRQARVSDAVNKAQAGDIDGYDGDLQTQFKIGVGAEYSGTKKELTYEFEGKIRFFIKIFLKIKNTINQLVGGEEGKNGFNFLPQAMKNSCITTARKLKRLPVMFEIQSPGVGLEIGWKNIYQNNSAVQQVETTFNFTPLIGGKGTLDLIAVASRLPYIGAIVTAVDKSLVALGINATFAISAVGTVGIEAKVSGTYSASKGFRFNKENYNITPTGSFGLEVELSAKGEWKVKTWILWGSEKSITAGASAEASSYFKAKIGFGADEKGPYVEGSVEFEGIKLILEIYGKVNDGGYTKNKDIDIVPKPETPILGGKKYFNDENKN